jgi:alpha-beta hydrolase superfamily lysophospholipase
MPDSNSHAFDFTTFLADKEAWSAPNELVPYRCRDGSSLGCRHYHPTRIPASTTHLILLHGSSADSRYLASLATHLATEGYHVHTPDLRGHGPTPARRGDIDHPLQLEEDLEDLIRSLDLPADASLWIAGHSAGGGLALRFAASALENGLAGIPLAGLILLAPYLDHLAPNMRRDSRWAQPRIARMLTCMLLNKLSIHRLDHLEVVTFNIPAEYRDANTTSAYSWRLMTGLNPRHYQRDLETLSRHHVPLLALIGDQDEAFHADRLEECLQPQHPAAHVTILEDVDHLGLATATVTAERIAEWLTSDPAA